MQCLGGLAAEIACILYLSSIDKAIDIIIKFVALASIAKVDDFYAAALPPDGNKIKKSTKPLMISYHKRDWAALQEEEDKGMECKEIDAEKGFKRTMMRIFYKTCRIMYGSYIFYFMPYTSVWLPYVAAVKASQVL